MMNTRALIKQQRFDLVMECRKSGLTDFQWCKENDIHPSTFYNWISRFREDGYPNIPVPTGKDSKQKALKQEVVKLEILPDEPMQFTSNNSQDTTFFYEENNNYTEPAMEIRWKGSVIRITNHINTQLLCVILNQLEDAK